MGVVRRTVRALQRAYSSITDSRGMWWRIHEPYAGAWQRNDEWTVDNVLAHPTVYACVNLIASDIAKMRARLVELKHDPDLWVETESSAFSPVLRRPNRHQTWAQFAKWWIISKLVHGNTYVLLDRDNRGVVVAMYILDPNRVKPLVAPDGDVFYQLNEDNLANWSAEDALEAVPSVDVIHDRIPLFHPLVGVSPLFAAGGPAHIGLTVQSNSAAYFDNDSSPPGILTAPGVIDQPTADQMVQRWHARSKGKIAVLGNGLAYEPLRGSVVESQTVEHLKWTAESVAAAFRVPAFMVGAGAVPALNNTEALVRQYFTTCLHDHVNDMETCLDRGLGLAEQTTQGRRLGIALNTEALLQMDTATLYKTLAEGVRGGFVAPNEARARIDLEPLVGGDTVYLQHQDYPIEALYDRVLQEPAAALPPAQQPPALPPGEPDDDEDALDEADRAALLALGLWLRDRASELEWRMAA